MKAPETAFYLQCPLEVYLFNRGLAVMRFQSIPTVSSEGEHREASAQTVAYAPPYHSSSPFLPITTNARYLEEKQQSFYSSALNHSSQPLKVSSSLDWSRLSRGMK